MMKITPAVEEEAFSGETKTADIDKNEARQNAIQWDIDNMYVL